MTKRGQELEARSPRSSLASSSSVVGKLARSASRRWSSSWVASMPPGPVTGRRLGLPVCSHAHAEVEALMACERMRHSTVM